MRALLMLTLPLLLASCISWDNLWPGLIATGTGQPLDRGNEGAFACHMDAASCQ